MKSINLSPTTSNCHPYAKISTFPQVLYSPINRRLPDKALLPPGTHHRRRPCTRQDFRNVANDTFNIYSAKPYPSKTATKESLETPATRFLRVFNSLLLGKQL